MLRPITTASRRSGSTPAITSARSWRWPRSTPPTASPAPSPMASRSRPSAPSTSPTSWRRVLAPSPSPVRCSSPVASISSTSTSPRPTSLSMTEEAVTPSAFIAHLGFGAEALALNDDGIDVVEDAVEDGGGERAVVVEDLRPVLVGTIGGDDHRRALVALADDLKQQIGTVLVDRQVAELVDD